jgi:hypothetical protein
MNCLTSVTRYSKSLLILDSGTIARTTFRSAIDTFHTIYPIGKEQTLQLRLRFVGFKRHGGNSGIEKGGEPGGSPDEEFYSVVPIWLSLGRLLLSIAYLRFTRHLYLRQAGMIRTFFSVIAFFAVLVSTVQERAVRQAG